MNELSTLTFIGVLCFFVLGVFLDIKARKDQAYALPSAFFFGAVFGSIFVIAISYLLDIL